MEALLVIVALVVVAVVAEHDVAKSKQRRDK